MRFLTRTFRNVLCVRVRKLIVRLWRSHARERSFEEACGETEVGRGLLAPEPRPLLALAPLTHPTSTQTEPQLKPATSAGVILPETGQFLLLCSLPLWQQLQHCRQSRARVPLFLCYILLPYCGNSLPRTTCFVGKRTVTIERSR